MDTQLKYMEDKYPTKHLTNAVAGTIQSEWELVLTHSLPKTRWKDLRIRESECKWNQSLGIGRIRANQAYL